MLIEKTQSFFQIYCTNVNSSFSSNGNVPYAMCKLPSNWYDRSKFGRHTITFILVSIWILVMDMKIKEEEKKNTDPYTTKCAIHTNKAGAHVAPMFI